MRAASYERQGLADEVLKVGELPDPSQVPGRSGSACATQASIPATPRSAEGQDADITTATEAAPSMAPADATAIVVGHDGSQGADQAFACALELAQALGAPVVVVRAWSIATAPRPPDWTFGYVPSFDELADAVRHRLMDDVRKTWTDRHEVPVDYRAVHASPAKGLIEISQGARMLVVGARGLGGLAGMLLGSVSDQCVRHAPCPVLVTRTRG
jgi:nucleotide-binding universal stress UspA family protein